MIGQIPEWLQIFLGSMIPGIESRFVVPFAIHEMGWKWYYAFPIGIAGNMILVPFGLLFLHKIEAFLVRYKTWKRFMDKTFPRIRRRADDKIQKYECLALIFFVAVPLPFTGAGLGVVIAYLFNLKFLKSIIMIFIGIVISTSFTTFMYLAFSYILFH